MSCEMKLLTLATEVTDREWRNFGEDFDPYTTAFRKLCSHLGHFCDADWACRVYTRHRSSTEDVFFSECKTLYIKSEYVSQNGV